MVVAELAELELLVAPVAEVAEGSRAVSCVKVPIGYWVGDEKMGMDCNNKGLSGVNCFLFGILISLSVWRFKYICQYSSGQSIEE